MLLLLAIAMWLTLNAALAGAAVWLSRRSAPGAVRPAGAAMSVDAAGAAGGGS